jgi:hypothetical protein
MHTTATDSTKNHRIDGEQAREDESPLANDLMTKA